MAVILDRLSHKSINEPIKQNNFGPDLKHDIERENFETNLKENRLNSTVGSVLSHFKKTWADLKFLKNKF